MRRILGSVLAALIAMTTACAAELPDFAASATSDSPATTASTGSSPPIPASTTTTEPPLVVPEQLTGLDVKPITIVDGDSVWSLMVAVADDDAERTRGLMNVADLGDLDGMLFLWESPITSSFWMQDVILPLDIAFFGEDMMLVDRFTMPLCTTDGCPSYPAAGPYNFAVEALELSFSELTPAATLTLDP